MPRIEFRRQRGVLSGVIADGAAEPSGFVAHAWALIGHACGAPGPDYDLAAVDAVRLGQGIESIAKAPRSLNLVISFSQPS